MQVKLQNGKTVKIPDTEIQKSMQILGLSRKEAIQMYLEDEGYCKNAEQETLTIKAKPVAKQMSRVTSNAKKSTPTKREKKIDTVKEDLIKMLANFLETSEGIEKVTIENSAKLIGFELNGEHYTIDLKRNRKPKK